MFVTAKRINTMKSKLEMWAELVSEGRTDFFATLQDFLDESGFELQSNVRSVRAMHLS